MYKVWLIWGVLLRLFFGCVGDCVSYGEGLTSSVHVGTELLVECYSSCVLCDTIYEGITEAVYSGLESVYVHSGHYSGPGNVNLFATNLSLLGDGSDSVVIDCEGEGFAFVLDATPGANITLSGFEFRNCSGILLGEFVTPLGFTLARYTGGAVSVFRNDSSFAGSDLIIRDCFRLDRADEGIAASLFGGAMAMFGPGQSELVDCIFEGNTATRGGAIYSSVSPNLASTDREEPSASVSLERCLFKNNAADLFGGAAVLSEAYVSISEGLFQNNTASNGGSVFVERSNVSLVASEFAHNRAIHGAGILSSVTTGVISNCSFTENVAVGGGAIVIFDQADLLIKHTDFVGNMGSEKAGAIGAFDIVGEVSIDRCRFISNQAANGGAIQFDNNEAPDGFSLWPIRNSFFVGNVAATTGAGISMSSHRALIQNCTFEQNIGSATLSGGAVYLAGADTFADILDSIFQDNAAPSGGTVYARAASFRFSNVSITRSLCPFSISCGRPVHLVESAQGELIYVLLELSYGGVHATQAGVVVRNSVFKDNAIASVEDGAAIEVVEGHLEVYDSHFSGMHTLLGRGGAIAASGEVITVRRCTFLGNSALEGGGVVLETINRGNVTVEDCTFKGNEAHFSGGAMYFETAENMAIRNCSFEENIAGRFSDTGAGVRRAGGGGAIASEGIESDVLLEDCRFRANVAYIGVDGVSAGDGGAVSVLYDITLTIRGCVFEQNIADRYGGAFYHGASEIAYLMNSVLNENYAENGGGAALFGELVVSDILIVNNRAGFSGGGLLLQSALLTIVLGDTVVVDKNEAVNDGGGIAMIGSAIILERSADDETCVTCLPQSLGDGKCNPECLSRQCNWDGGDCIDVFSQPFDADATCDCVVGNGVCEAACFRVECDFDGGDCDGLTADNLMECPHFLALYLQALEEVPVQFVEDGSHCRLPFNVGREAFDSCTSGHSLQIEEWRFSECEVADSTANSTYEERLPLSDVLCEDGGYLLSYESALELIQHAPPLATSVHRGTIQFQRPIPLSDAHLSRLSAVFTPPVGLGGVYEFAAIGDSPVHVYVIPENENGTFASPSAEYLVVVPQDLTILPVNPNWDIPAAVGTGTILLDVGIRYLVVVDVFAVFTSFIQFELGRTYPPTANSPPTVFRPTGTEYFDLPDDSPLRTQYSDDLWCITADPGQPETWGTCTNGTYVYSMGIVDSDLLMSQLDVGHSDPLYYAGTCFDTPLVFSNNTAGGNGGGLFVGDCSSNDVLCFLNTPHNPPAMAIVFQDNQAALAGGGFFMGCTEVPFPCLDSLSHIAHLDITSWHFEGNWAGGYGSDRASAVARTAVVQPVDEAYYSGAVLRGSFHVVDAFGQVIRSPDGLAHPYTLRSVVCRSRACPFGDVVSVEHHRFEGNISNLEESEHTILFALSDDDEPLPEMFVRIEVVNERDVPTKYFSVERLACPSGRRIVRSPSTSREECVLCLYGEYSILNDSFGCYDCPVGAVCPGGWQINAEASYWSPCRNVLDTDTCHHNNGEVELWTCARKGGCEAGAGEIVMSCHASHEPDSRLCKQCKSGFWGMRNQCYTCHSSELGAYNVIVFCALLLWLPTARWAAVNFPVLYIALPYLQVLSIISEFNIQWPTHFGSFLQSFSALNFDLALSQMECFLPRNDFFMIRFLAYMALPVLYGVLYFMRPLLFSVYNMVVTKERVIARGWTVLPVLQPSHLKETRSLAMHTFLFTLNQLYLSCITKAFEVFGCTNYGDDDDYYLTVSPQTRCHGSEYKVMLGVSMLAIIVYVFFVPMMFVWIIGVYGRQLRKSGHPEENYFRRTFGFLYERFEPEFYFWEIMTMFRKLGFSVMRIFFQYDSLLQTSLCMLLVVAAIMLHFTYRPFVQSRMDILECVLLASMFLVLLLAPLYNGGSTHFYAPSEVVGELLGFTAASVGLCAVSIVGYLDVKDYMAKKIAPADAFLSRLSLLSSSFNKTAPMATRTSPSSSNNNEPRVENATATKAKAAPVESPSIKPSQRGNRESSEDPPSRPHSARVVPIDSSMVSHVDLKRPALHDGLPVVASVSQPASPRELVCSTTLSQVAQVAPTKHTIITTCPSDRSAPHEARISSATPLLPALPTSCAPQPPVEAPRDPSSPRPRVLPPLERPPTPRKLE
eukprot:Rmarinus@m.14089